MLNSKMLLRRFTAWLARIEKGVKAKRIQKPIQSLPDEIIVLALYGLFHLFGVDLNTYISHETATALLAIVMWLLKLRTS
jgi:hypothetical protein